MHFLRILRHCRPLTSARLPMCCLAPMRSPCFAVPSYCGGDLVAWMMRSRRILARYTLSWKNREMSVAFTAWSTTVARTVGARHTMTQVVRRWQRQGLVLAFVSWLDWIHNTTTRAAYATSSMQHARCVNTLHAFCCHRARPSTTATAYAQYT